MLKTTIISFALAVLASAQGIASAEYFLEWTSAVIQCEKTAEAGDISCEIKTGEKGFTAFTVRAFGKAHVLSESDLIKLKDFPLSSLHTTHEGGYKSLGGYTVHFRFERTFYNSAKKLTTEIVYVSVNKEGISVFGPRVHQTAGQLPASPTASPRR